ncbi:hypothetical protein MUNTM_11950, partial [Mycobacterium sp. MUNTM1]
MALGGRRHAGVALDPPPRPPRRPGLRQPTPPPDGPPRW